MKVEANNVLVLPRKNPPSTSKGIIIPETVGKIDNVGLIVDCGPTCEICVKGRQLHYSVSGASIIEIEGVEHHFISEDRVLYVYGK